MINPLYELGLIIKNYELANLCFLKCDKYRDELLRIDEKSLISGCFSKAWVSAFIRYCYYLENAKRIMKENELALNKYRSINV